MNKTQTEKVRSEFIAEMEAEAWRKQCSVAFMRESAVGMDTNRRNILAGAKVSGAEADAAEIKAAAENDHTRATRDNIKALRELSNSRRELARQIGGEIVEIVKGADTMESESRERLNLAEFAKTYGMEKKPETEAKQDKKQ